MTTAARAKDSRSSRKAIPGKTFSEFFAGIGLVRLGLEASGWRCVYANDNDPKKAELYEARFGNEEHFHLGDVCDTDAVVARMAKDTFLATASFPCIDLSLAGHWRGLQGEHSSTFFGFANALDSLGRGRPKLIMIENVTGLISSHGGNDFASITQALAEFGYWLDAFVIDAKYFVPQSRPRIFIVGVHRSLKTPWPKPSRQFQLSDPWLQAMEASGEVRPERLVRLMKKTELATGWLATPIKTPVTQRSPLAELIDLDDGQDWWDKPQVDKHYNMMSDRHRTLVDGLLEKKGVHIGTVYRRKRYGKTRAEVRFDGIAGCLRTPKGGSARQIVIVLDNGVVRFRWMSPREYSRLQGTGDYPLVGKPNQQMFGFGDAVCVPVVEWVDQHVLTPAYEYANI